MEYKYDEESVNALMKWAENAQLPKELQLSEAEKIVNLRQYIVANINDIKAHYPDEFHRVIRILSNKDYSVELCVTPW